MLVHAHHYKNDRVGLNSTKIEYKYEGELVAALASFCKVPVREMSAAWDRVFILFHEFGEATIYLDGGRVNLTKLE